MSLEVMQGDWRDTGVRQSVGTAISDRLSGNKLVLHE